MAVIQPKYAAISKNKCSLFIHSTHVSFYREADLTITEVEQISANSQMENWIHTNREEENDECL